MKKFFLLIVFMFYSLSAFAFYQDLTMGDRIKLAEAYYLVGTNYNQIKKNSGNSYISMAYKIYPELDPKSISSDTSSLPENIDPEKIIADIREEETTRVMISYRFKRMVRAFLAKDMKSTMLFFDSAVYVSAEKKYYQNSEIESSVSASIKNAPFSLMEPENLYNLDAITIVKAPLSFQKIYPKSYILKVTSNVNFGSAIPFWTQEQSFYYRSVNEKFLIFGIGDIDNTEVIAEYAKSEGLNQDIKAQLLEAMDAFLQKNPDKVSSYLADTIRIIPMETSISKAEAKLSFEGFFEQLNVDGSLKAQDIVTSQGIEVDHADVLYLDLPQGTREAKLTIKDEYKDILPFWSSYTKYYFFPVQGVWKIIAIS
ncbi:MAG: hypothetical protein JXR70_19485 [Spirochaetales bacterium]|nr:hypothetical protein [Spirochaetales bacterium]